MGGGVGGGHALGFGGGGMGWMSFGFVAGSVGVDGFEGSGFVALGVAFFAGGRLLSEAAAGLTHL